MVSRGPIDDVVAEMLSQILQTRGHAPHIIEYRAVTRDEITNLDLTGVSTVVVIGFEISSSPASALPVTALARKALAVRIIAGLQSDGDMALDIKEVQSVRGADACVRTLREATDAVLEPDTASH